MLRCGALCVVCAAAACFQPPTAAQPDLARLAPVAPPVAVAPTPPLPPHAEVEMAATVTVPNGVVGEVHGYVTDGECWKAGTRAFSDQRVRQGSWGDEVFVPQGTS